MRQYISLAAILVCLSHSLHAQHWKWEAGLSNTSYSFQTSTGQQTNFMKPNGGVHMGFAYNKEIIDTTAMISKFSKSSIFFSNNKKLAKVVSFFRYEVGLNLTQLNAVGDVQNRQLSYQTSFGGLHLGFGPEVKIYRGFSLAIQGKFSPMKMINGIQQRDMNYFSLSQDPSFSKVQLFYGYNIAIHKRLADKTSVFFSYDVMSTVNKAQTGKSNLNCEPSIIIIGLKVSQF